jgi:hypothetical protein
MPPPQTKKMTGKLEVTAEPEDTFFKDEGGKNHCLTVDVKLSDLKVGTTSAKTFKKWCPTLPLKISLYYESGFRVEERDQDILKLLGSDFDCPSLDPETLSGSIRYRIEKVSRRKDGQRFKVFVEVDDEKCVGVDASGIQGCYSIAVCVRSKRKASKAKRDFAAALAGGRGAKRQRRSSDSTKLGYGSGIRGDVAMQLATKLAQLGHKMDEMLRILMAQQQHIMNLESVLRRGRDGGNLSSSAAAASLSRLSSADSRFSLTSFAPFASQQPSFSSRGTPVAAASKANLMMRRTLSNNSLTGGGIRAQPGLALKRLRSGDMQFNFGPPSSPQPIGEYIGSGKSSGNGSVGSGRLPTAEPATHISA